VAAEGRDEGEEGGDGSNLINVGEEDGEEDEEGRIDADEEEGPDESEVPGWCGGGTGRGVGVERREKLFLKKRFLRFVLLRQAHVAEAAGVDKDDWEDQEEGEN